MWMELANALGSVYLTLRRRRLARFRAAALRCREVQAEVLRARIARHAESDFGREYGLRHIRTLADFRRQVPLSNYESYAPYIEAVKNGRTQALFAPGTRVLMFALTSGTTAEAKYIPITREFLEDYRRGWNLWGTQAYTDHPGVRKKYNVTLASDWRQFHTPGGIPCGNISGLAHDTATLFLRALAAVPRAVRSVPDPLAKQYAVLRTSIACSRIGMTVTANPSTLVGLARLAHEKREELIRDIRDGTLTGGVEIPPESRRALERHTRRPNPERARELEQIVDRTGTLAPREFWPGLALLGVWTGGSAGAYLGQLREYYGDVPIRDHGLSASEGRMTLPLADDTSAGLLDLWTQYFEFIPEEEHDRPQPTVLEAHELVPGANYYIVLTTASGFFRYDIHDVVRCVGREGTTPILEFLNKGAHFSSVTGEKLSEFQVVTAVRDVFAEAGLRLPEFTLAPEWGEVPRYLLLTEPGEHHEQAAALARGIDLRLVKLNREYADRRQTGRLGPPELVPLRPGTWSAFRRARIARPGGSLEQYKHPCLVGDLTFVDQLAALEPARTSTLV
jgi:hypothetical protein